MKTTLKSNVFDVDSSDWDMIAPGISDKIHQAAVSGEEVTITSVEVDNGVAAHNYYNIKLADGTVVPAISGIHLESLPVQLQFVVSTLLPTDRVPDELIKSLEQVIKQGTEFMLSSVPALAVDVKYEASI